VSGTGDEDLYREFEHTGDLGIELEARSRGELYAHATIAVARIMVDPEGIRTAERRRVEVLADSDADLMHDLLAAALNLFLCDGFIWCDAHVVEESADRIAVELEGENFDARRHRLLTEIKAVTYHELRVEPSESGWSARILFDI
jgi:protein archease